ncbi:P-loop containing nucleoside triphosphate hydrolase [Pseudocohnilembus persalinus]|uniref:p-loop containing nucleoside triphosphate hydrolase n=1 Tax=Pseudocohnilembus persalinus TaxID=266149 RepID=A0A0V0QAU3_PSEPJ|nr:P-loop containing nucleoside triphosphate hydrolase [Pseudocohnilembus persalinus]|eukprot:KRW99347.1 P-loop containing nucleoside triphosphate hydrolase [Pseudocohnilembus persalinus]
MNKLKSKERQSIQKKGSDQKLEILARQYPYSTKNVEKSENFTQNKQDNQKKLNGKKQLKQYISLNEFQNQKVSIGPESYTLQNKNGNNNLTPAYNNKPFKYSEKNQKLYSPHEYIHYSTGLKSFKDNYIKGLQQLGFESAVLLQDRNLNEIYNKTGQIMGHSYSSKYIGIKDNNLGISSFRKKISEMTPQEIALKNKQLRTEQERIKSTLSRQKNFFKLQENQSQVQSQDEVYQNEQQQYQIGNIKNPQNQNFQQITNGQKNEIEVQPQPELYDQYIVSKYSLPKGLKALKKPKSDDDQENLQKQKKLQEWHKGKQSGYTEHRNNKSFIQFKNSVEKAQISRQQSRNSMRNEILQNQNKNQQQFSGQNYGSQKFKNQNNYDQQENQKDLIQNDQNQEQKLYQQQKQQEKDDNKNEFQKQNIKKDENELNNINNIQQCEKEDIIDNQNQQQQQQNQYFSVKQKQEKFQDLPSEQMINVKAGNQFYETKKNNGNVGKMNKFKRREIRNFKDSGEGVSYCFIDAPFQEAKSFSRIMNQFQIRDEYQQQYQYQQQQQLQQQQSNQQMQNKIFNREKQIYQSIIPLDKMQVNYQNTNLFDKLKSIEGVLSYKKIIDHPNKGKICLDLKDTAGQEKLNSITFTYLKGVQALIFVYDVTDKKSFLNLETEINRILDNIVQPDTPIVIVGNKYDVDKKNHKVKEEEGQKLAQSYKCAHFFASAKENYNIDQIFEYLVETIDLEKLSCYNLSISKNPKLKNQQSSEKKDYDRKICGCI